MTPIVVFFVGETNWGKALILNSVERRNVLANC